MMTKASWSSSLRSAATILPSSAVPLANTMVQRNSKAAAADSLSKQIRLATCCNHDGYTDNEHTTYVAAVKCLNRKPMMEPEYIMNARVFFARRRLRVCTTLQSCQCFARATNELDYVEATYSSGT
ncbi:MAG: hypothetical protein NXY57DRAFT_998084 [Lentinula lateritia]|nr:MAG: hypothetical protein NXY57DRAFT_998084 [Lentinula lateritia]